MPDVQYVSGGFRPFEVNAPGSSTSSIFMAEARGGLKTARTIPAHHHLAEAGRIYTAQFGVVTNAVASVTDVPTTGAHFALWNGETAGAGARCYSILGIGVSSASGTTGIGISVWGGVSSAAQSTVTTTSGNLIKSCAGSSAYTSKAAADSTLTLSGAPAWAMLGVSNTIAGVALGYGYSNYALEGMFYVPPTYVFALAVVGLTGTSPAFLATITWAEIEGYPV